MASGGAQALVGVRRRHAHVDDGEVGLVALDGDEQGVAVADGGHDLLAGVDEQAGQAGSQEHGVLGDHDAHGSSTITVVGPPAGLSTCMRPPRAATRSARPCEAAAAVGDRRRRRRRR